MNEKFGGISQDYPMISKVASASDTQDIMVAPSVAHQPCWRAPTTRQEITDMDGHAGISSTSGISNTQKYGGCLQHLATLLRSWKAVYWLFPVRCQKPRTDQLRHMVCARCIHSYTNGSLTYDSGKPMLYHPTWSNSKDLTTFRAVNKNCCRKMLGNPQNHGLSSLSIRKFTNWIGWWEKITEKPYIWW